jgi:hypothetical protein
MPAELWSWLRESIAVRPSVVARVKASLEAGERRSPDDIALAMLDRCPYRGKFAPYREVAPRA